MADGGTTRRSNCASILRHHPGAARTRLRFIARTLRSVDHDSVKPPKSEKIAPEIPDTKQRYREMATRL
jgi:hypothetical protein